jgi:hypothetical protein
MKSSPLESPSTTSEPLRSRLRAVATLLGPAALPATTVLFAAAGPKLPPFVGD